MFVNQTRSCRSGFNSTTTPRGEDTHEKEKKVSQTDSPTASFVHRIWSSAVWSGVLAVILGAVILAWPGPSIVVTSGVFGAYLVVSGVVMVVLGFSIPAPAAGRFLSVISGVASVVLGVLAFKHFDQGY